MPIKQMIAIGLGSMIAIGMIGGIALLVIRSGRPATVALVETPTLSAVETTTPTAEATVEATATPTPTVIGQATAMPKPIPPQPRPVFAGAPARVPANVCTSLGAKIDFRNGESILCWVNGLVGTNLTWVGDVRKDQVSTSLVAQLDMAWLDCGGRSSNYPAGTKIVPLETIVSRLPDYAKWLKDYIVAYQTQSVANTVPRGCKLIFLEYPLPTSGIVTVMVPAKASDGTPWPDSATLLMTGQVVVGLERGVLQCGNPIILIPKQPTPTPSPTSSPCPGCATSTPNPPTETPRPPTATPTNPAPSSTPVIPTATPTKCNCPTPATPVPTPVNNPQPTPVSVPTQVPAKPTSAPTSAKPTPTNLPGF